MQVGLVELLEGLSRKQRNKGNGLSSVVLETAVETLNLQDEIIGTLAGLIGFYASEHKAKLDNLHSGDASRGAAQEKYDRNRLTVERVLEICPWLDREDLEDFDLASYDQTIGL
jgi:hypothetical protein